MKIHTQFYIEKERKENFKVRCFVDGRTQSRVIDLLMDYYIANGLPPAPSAHTKKKAERNHPPVEEILEYAALMDIEKFNIKATPYDTRFKAVCHRIGIKDERTIMNRWQTFLSLGRKVE